MSSRLEALEARRRALLNACEEQRLELSYRVARLAPRTALTAWTRRGRAGKLAIKGLMPLIAGAGGLVMLLLRLRRRRPRRGRGRASGGGAGLGGIGLLTTAVALATRASTVLRLVAQLRALYLTYKATHRP